MNLAPGQAEFEKQIYTYYNQYCASPKTTQDRRIMRNYLSNQQSIKQWNRNPFTQNKNKKYYFQYEQGGTYMYIEFLPVYNTKKVMKYTFTGNCWCHQNTYHIPTTENIQTWICNKEQKLQ